MTKDIFTKGVSKAVPILGAAVSGGLTLATFKPMTNKLQKHLSEMAHMSPAEFAKYEAANAVVIDEKDFIVVNEQVEGWICSCGSVNKGKFCPDCGKAKPAGLPQYKCDKCGWEPENKACPPNFCPDCGDPFDAGDIVQA